MASQPAPPATRPLFPVYAIFEGGGATGMAHVGAVKAMEALDIRPVGVAGASAGAIIAALLAVGVRADDMLGGPDPVRWNIFLKHGATPVALLGKANWSLLPLLRRKWLAVPIAALLLLSPFGPFLLAAIGLTLLLRLCGIGGPFGLWYRLGFFRTREARNFLNARLLERVQEAALKSSRLVPPAEHRVTFADIDPAYGFTPLKIVVTNIDQGRLEIIDNSCQDTVVADAVIASMSIPMLFRPAKIRGYRPRPGRYVDASDRYVDGGLVSNLPIWVFLQDKLAAERQRGNRRPLPILAFQLKRVPGGSRENPANGSASYLWNGLFAYLGQVAHTGVFGSQKTIARTIPNLEIVEIKSELGLLAFDCGRGNALAARDWAEEQAHPVLARRFHIWPADVQAALDKLLRETRALLADIKAADGTPRFAAKQLATARLALLLQADGGDLRVVAAANRKRDADDIMAYDLNSPAAPLAFRTRDSHFFRLSGQSAKRLLMTKYEFVRQRPSLELLIAVPIFQDVETWNETDLQKRPNPLGLLVLDGDFDLKAAYESRAVLMFLVGRSVEFAGQLRP